MPTNFITSTYQQNISTEFLSFLTRDLEGVLRDPDLKSHDKKVRKLHEANELNSPTVQPAIASQL